MFEDKHCDTCDCHLRVCGIQRHKIKGFLLMWAGAPFLFVTVMIFVAKSYYNLQIPLFWLLLVGLAVNWIWIVMELIIPGIEEIKYLAQGCAALLLDMTCRFYRCCCFCCRYCYKEARRTSDNQSATTQTSTRYSLEHVVPESPNVSPEMYSNENPPPLPERQGKVGKKESPIVYDLIPRLKQQSTSISDFERSPIKDSKGAGLSDTLPQTGHASGATGGKTQAGHRSGATGGKTQAGRSRGATVKKTQTGHSSGDKTQTAHTSGATGGRTKTSYVSVASCTSMESGNVRGACGTRTETDLKPQINPTSRNLSAIPQNSPSRNSGVITKTGRMSSNLSTTLKTSPASSDLGVSPKTSPAASSFGASPDVSPTGVSLGGRRKPTTCPARCLFPDSKSLTTSFGKTIDETEDIDGSICQIDLSHISVPISLPPSVSAGHSVHDSYQKDASRYTVQLPSNPHAASKGATQITTHSHVQQSVSSYIPFVPDNQPQNPINLKDCENIDSSLSQSNSSQIKVPQVSPTDPARVRVSPQASPTDPERVSPRVTPSHLTHMKMSIPYHKQEKISSLTFPNDHCTQGRTRPEVQVSDSTRLNTSPKIFDPEGARSIPGVAGIRQSQSSYVPFVPDNIQLVVTPPDSDRSNIPPIKANLSSERHETNIFTSSFGKTIDLTENIDDSILQLDASHIHVPILPRTEQTSSPHPLEPKFSSQTSAPGFLHLRTSPLASAPGSPQLKTSPLASASGSLQLKTSPLASASGSLQLKTSPLASASGSPQLKTSPLASKPGSPYSKQSYLPSTSGSQNLKLSPRASSDSQYLKTIPLPSSSDSPPLMTSSPIMMRPVSNFGKLIYTPTFPLSRLSSPDSESVSPHRTSPETSAPTPQPVDETKNIYDPISICLLDLSHISVPISLPSSATAGPSVHDPFEKVHLNTSPQASDHLTSPQTSNYVPYIPNQPGPTQSISRDVCGVQSTSDEQNQEATRTYTKFSIPSHRNRRGRENNSVEGIDGGRSSAYLSSSSSSESIDLQGSKLRRIRSTSEKYKVKKSVCDSATTRRKTL